MLDKLFSLFFEVVGKKQSQDEFMKTIFDLLSPVERIMIAKRVAIIYLLMKQIDQRVICQILKVSSVTVAKFSLLMEKSQGIVPTFRRALVNEKLAEFFEDIFNSFFAPGVPGINWKAAWQRKVARDRKKAFGI